jgi:hypothetical protein
MCTERSMTCTCHTVSAFDFKCHVTYCSMLQCIRACCRSRVERSNCPSCRAISDIYGLCLRCQTSDSSKKNVLAGSGLMCARQCLQMNVLCCRCCRSTAVVSCLCCQMLSNNSSSKTCTSCGHGDESFDRPLWSIGPSRQQMQNETARAICCHSNVRFCRVKRDQTPFETTWPADRADFEDWTSHWAGNGQCQSARVWHRTWCRLWTAVVSSR